MLQQALTSGANTGFLQPGAGQGPDGKSAGGAGAAPSSNPNMAGLSGIGHGNGSQGQAPGRGMTGRGSVDMPLLHALLPKWHLAGDGDNVGISTGSNLQYDTTDHNAQLTGDHAIGAGSSTHQPSHAGTGGHAGLLDTFDTACAALGLDTWSSAGNTSLQTSATPGAPGLGPTRTMSKVGAGAVGRPSTFC